MSSSDFKNFLEKDILTYTKGAVERILRKWYWLSDGALNLQLLKKKSFDLEHGI